MINLEDFFSMKRSRVHYVLVLGMFFCFFLFHSFLSSLVNSSFPNALTCWCIITASCWQGSSVSIAYSIVSLQGQTSVVERKITRDLKQMSNHNTQNPRLVSLCIQSDLSIKVNTILFPSPFVTMWSVLLSYTYTNTHTHIYIDILHPPQ